MTGRIKAPKRSYQPQEPHTAEDCRINEQPHCHPDMDCGHYVASGPGYQMDQDAAMVGPGNPGTEPPHNDDQDEANGPGVQ